MEILISNVEFISTIFPENANVAVCSKKGDPNEGGWFPQLFSGDSILGDESNNYVNSACFQLEEGGVFNVQKKNFKSFNFVLLDDLGTKVQFERLGNFEPTWLTETSPGNFQAGIVLKEPITNINEAEGLQKSILNAGYGDAGAGGVNRWARLPNAINGKGKHLDEGGNPFQCKLTQWNPQARYTVQELMDGLQITIESELRYDNEVYTPKAFENPVIAALKERGLYKRLLVQVNMTLPVRGCMSILINWIREQLILNPLRVMLLVDLVVYIPMSSVFVICSSFLMWKYLMRVTNH